NMAEHRGCAGYRIPGETADGQPFLRVDESQLRAPHGLLVNGRGQRFVDECAPGDELFRALERRDCHTGEAANLPAYHLFDSQLLRRRGYGPATPGVTAPSWMITAPDMPTLAQHLDIDPAA